MDEVTTMRDSNGPPFERIRRLVEAPVFEDGDQTRTARVLRRTALIIVGIGVVGIVVSLLLAASPVIGVAVSSIAAGAARQPIAGLTDGRGQVLPFACQET